MKILDFIMYIFYVSSRVDRENIKRIYTAEEYARNYFCLVFVSIGALLISTITFKIEPYRKLLFKIMPPVYAGFWGIGQAGVTAFVLLYLIKKHYTDERIKQIGLTFSDHLTKKMAIVLYAIIFLIHISLFMLLLFYMISSLFNKRITIR